MQIISAKIQNFRNLQPLAVEFSPGVNLVLGRNGEGKTNFLEALNFLSLGRSHRGCRQDEVINFTADKLFINLLVSTAGNEALSFDCGLERGGGRRVKIAGRPIHRLTDLVGRLVTVFFDPDSIRLVRGSPQHRRQFVDRGLAELDPPYLNHLTAFQRTLRQKTSLLRDRKNGIRTNTGLREEITAWNRELAGHAVEICLGRHRYAQLIGPWAAAKQTQLSRQERPLSFCYRPNLESAGIKRLEACEKPAQKSDLAGEIFREIDYIVEHEIRRGRPLRGPQLDDFEIRLGDVDQRVFGSQGETRTAAVSLILAHSDVLHQQHGNRPVLFFDDIFSELDRDRARRLQELAACDHQVFIATARTDDVARWRPEKVRVWEVKAGELSDSGLDP